MRGFRMRGCGRRVEAGAPARLQIAHRNQAVVGLNHRETADIVGLGEVPDGRQLGAGPQMPIVDLSLDAGDDVLGQGLVGIVTDSEESMPIARLAELARSLDQYSYPS